MTGKVLKLLTGLAIGAACLALVMLVVPGIALGIALAAGSQRTVFERAVSPDDKLEARVQFDDCGAACSFDRIVLIKQRWFNDEPLLSCRAFLAEGEAPVHLRWLDSHHLVITHGFKNVDVVAKADRCGSTQIQVNGA